MSVVNEKQKPVRAGFVALIGQPNAGKSTLINALLGEKVAIVSKKPQTTRTRVTGILNLEHNGQKAQVIFVDSPGVISSTSGINRFLQEEAEDVMEQADVICLLVPADSSSESVLALLAKARRHDKPLVLIITKSDLLTGTRTPRFFQDLLEQKVPFISVSSLRNAQEAREEILTRVVPLLPESQAPLFDSEIYTTQTLRGMAAEFVRESCFEFLRQEVPYGLAVRILEFNENGAVVHVRAEIVVDRAGHKGIVIGAGGKMLKQIGTESRKAIEKLVGRQVFLELHVHVKENWTQNVRLMKELGYAVAKE